MGEEKIDEPKRVKRLPSQKLSSICSEQKKGLLGTWKLIAHHPLHKLSTQGWIIKQTGFPCLVLVWNLAMLCDLYIPGPALQLAMKKRKATYEGQGNNIRRASPNEDFMGRRNTSFSKNISWDIYYICKGDFVRYGSYGPKIELINFFCRLWSVEVKF